jgi:hypothetical protein
MPRVDDLEDRGRNQPELAHPLGAGDALAFRRAGSMC